MTDENRKNPGIKIPHISIENSPIVEGMRCIEVWIPDDDRYARLVSGLMAIPTKWFNWQRDAAHTGQALAKQWEKAYLFTEWGHCMSCDDVADCIENDEGVKAALEANLIENINNSIDVQNALNQVYNQFGVNPMPPAVTGQNLLPEGIACDKDAIWAGIVNLIDQMNQNNIDSFEITEAASNLSERAALVFGAIPILETLPVDEAINYVQTIWTDDLFEAYIANDTTAYRDELKCDLLCIATSGNCGLNIDDMFNYFLARISASASDTFAELVAYIITGTWVGTEINDMFFAGQIIMMYYGNRYLDMVGIRSFQTYLDIGARDPSDTWMILCDDCPLEAHNVGLFNLCGSGVVNMVEFEDGVAFELEAYAFIVGSVTSYVIALKLPGSGSWNVQLNSITGTITPPADTSETAYAWNDDTGFHNVLWNAPAEPSDFGNHDTEPGVFTAWCTTQDWNAALFNGAPFTANFTVTAV